MSEYLGDRRKALEESFFAKQEQKLLDEIRQQRDQEAGIQALAGACGIDDASVVEALIGAGIEPETLPALTLIPLVMVAWADGKVQDEERTAILESAASHGVRAGQPPAVLLESWLAVRPPDSLFDAWLGYAEGLRDQLGETERQAVKRDLVGRARAVAAAAGGILGIGPKTSGAEKAVLEKIEAAL
ncbi:MAG: hypothetical protein VCC02_13520 [Myxococcota bacterium]|jgi:hypothetical protein